MDYDRVTDILEPFSGMKYVAANVLENACVRGTKVHKYCEAICSGAGVWDVPPEYQGYVDSFLKWWKDYPILALEKRFYCNDLGITGQIDLIMGTPEKAVVVDFKTSKAESKTWALQGSAYSHLAKQAGFNVNDIMFLRINAEGKAPKLHYYEENMTLFKECINVYRYFFRRKGKKI